MSNDHYENPLITRYASSEMSNIWSANRKFRTWRRLWIALAEAEQELGLEISNHQLEQLRQQQNNVDFELAARYEREFRHDVMAHVHTYGDAAPDARGIIHLGATSCFVTDNTDIILLRDALLLIRTRLMQVIDQLGSFASEHRDLPCLGFTHFQPAQPTTVGKRATLWAQDLWLDLQEVDHRLETLRARSVKGTTGTQASFLELFRGNHKKVKQLEKLVAQKIGFDDSYPVTGQTYPRKIDSQVVDVLSGISQSAHKSATDLRLLASLKEVEEPYEKNQIGSSAMAYKRNPMRCERICALARFVISLQSSPPQTVATQWMERTLDDSANRRLVLPQAFLATDALLILYENVSAGLVVYPKVIAQRLLQELPFMATENILMEGVSKGGDRQVLHERIRLHSLEAAKMVKMEGAKNDLLERLSNDPLFADINFLSLMDTKQFIGRAPEQVDEFLAKIVAPIRQRISESDRIASEVRV